MFYSAELLSLKNRGKFSICWVAATLRTNSPLTKADIMSVNIVKLCDDILEYIVTKSGQPEKRMSLYLSAQLLYGTCIIFYKQVCYFQDDVFYHYRHAHRVRSEKKQKHEEKSLVARKEVKKRKRITQQQEQQELLLRQAEGEMVIPQISKEQENLVLEPVPQILPNVSAITMLEDAPSVRTVPQPEGGFGDEENINQLLTTFDELSRLAGQPHPTMPVTADIHFQPPPTPSKTNLRETRIPEQDQPPEPRTLEKKTPSSARKRRREQDDEIEHVHTPKTRVVAWKDDDVTLQMSPRGKSTPLPDHEKRSSKKDSGDIHLETIVEDSQSEKRGRHRRRRKLIFDDDRIIRSAELVAQMKDPKAHTFEKVHIVDLHAPIPVNILFQHPARMAGRAPLKIIMADALLQQFSWKVSKREHSFDIMNEFSKIEQSLRNITVEESVASRLGRMDITPIEPVQPPLQTTLPGQEIPQIPDQSIQMARQEITLPEEQQIIETEIPPPVKDITSEPNITDISAKGPAPQESNRRPSKKQTSVKDADAALLEGDKRPGEKQSEEEIGTFSGSRKIKADILKKLKEYWARGEDEILFSTLCPVPGTNKRTAALTFYFLIELSKKKKVILTRKDNSLEIYSIKRLYQ